MFILVSLLNRNNLQAGYQELSAFITDDYWNRLNKESSMREATLSTESKDTTTMEAIILHVVHGRICFLGLPYSSIKEQTKPIGQCDHDPASSSPTVTPGSDSKANAYGSSMIRPAHSAKSSASSRAQEISDIHPDYIFPRYWAPGRRQLSVP
ncbi:hypothetical protein F443_08306 [Phytophthora nicotianae P1569]|uniref:Uncharacterized protein n=1 Tax=Phytophthora nicotianae P1569 TaxID=1317065 RepID=V9F7N2_PHYNI|nr:hypothetical protein F443_08306 [Phytophthora nicotianae P1569]